MDDKNAKEVAKSVSSMLNTMCPDENVKDFVEAMSCEHRTLQASFSRLVFAWVKKLAEQSDSGHFDLRNAQPVKTGKKIMEAVEDVDLYVPMI